MNAKELRESIIERWGGCDSAFPVDLDELVCAVRAETLREASMLADERARVLLIEAVHESQCQGRALEVFAAQLAVMARAKEGR